MWRWHEHMWGHGWAWMHGRSGPGFRHHAWMMGGSGAGGDNGLWLSSEALMIALMVILVAAIVVGALWVARRRPAAPHAG